MARKEKTILGQVNNISAQKQFTDREEPQASFIKSLAEVNTKNYSILTYYGVGGIGKSSLQKHLKEYHLDNNKDTIYSWVDFKIESNRSIQKTLRILSHNFRLKFDIKFPIFDMAYFIYWSKAFPDYDIKKDKLPFLEEGSQLSSIIDTFAEFGGMMSNALSLLDYAYKKSKEFTFNPDIKQELENLKQLDADSIEDKLAIFFARDIDNYKELNPEKKVVIFIDTYEALWQVKRDESNEFSQDQWVRDIIIELTNVLFVICGREQIIWAKYEKEWEEDLNQHLLGKLSKEDSLLFLNSCEITDSDIQEKIIESSEGNPFYLDLCVDTFYQIRNRGHIPTKEDFSKVDQNKIFERFMRYLNQSEQETLKVLANARFYNKALFSFLVDKFKTGYPVTAMNQLNSFSFISEENGNFFIHSLMRNSLIQYQDIDIKEDINNTLFHYYIEMLNNSITNKTRVIDNNMFVMISEAIYYLDQINNIKVLLQWFHKSIREFCEISKGGKNRIMEPSISYAKNSIDNQNISIEERERMQKYLNSRQYFSQILEFFEKTIENINATETDELLIISNCQNTLGIFFLVEEELDKSLKWLEKAKSIKESIYGKNHTEIKSIYYNLAQAYANTLNHQKAIYYADLVLDITYKKFGDVHLETASALELIADCCEKYGKVNPKIIFAYYKKAYEIYIELLGEKNPKTFKVGLRIAQYLKLGFI